MKVLAPSTLELGIVSLFNGGEPQRDNKQIKYASVIDGTMKSWVTAKDDKTYIAANQGFGRWRRSLEDASTSALYITYT